MSTPAIAAESAAPLPPRRSQGSGCASYAVLGCAVLIALAIVVVFALWRWAVSPTPLAGEDQLLGPDVGAIAVLTADFADPGTASFFGVFFDKSDHAAPSFVRRAFPIRLAVALRGAPPRPLGILSLSRYANLLRLPLLPAKIGVGEGVEAYRDELIVRGDGGSPGAFAFTGGDIVFAGDVGGVRYALDRLVDGAQGPAPDLARLWERAEKAPIRAAAVNRSGEIVVLWDALLGEVLGGEIEIPGREVAKSALGLTLSARPGVPAAASISGHLTLTFDHDPAHEAEALRGAASAIANRLRGRHVEPSAELTVAGNTLSVRFRVDEVARAISGRSVRFGPVEVR